jgi:hypothetical protein
MIRRHFLSALFTAAVLASPVAAQPVKDLADLFPPDSLLYVEVVKPAEIAQNFSALIKGSILEDMIPFMAKWREKDQNGGLFLERQMLGMLSAFAGPEILAEVSRLQGAALAITGLDKKQEPNVVFVMLPGQSNLPGFFMRIALMTADMRPAAQVDGITVYGNKPFVFNRVGVAVAPPPLPGAAPPPPPPPPPLEAPFIAYMPGVIVMGGSAESVGDVIKRMKAKNPPPSLIADPGFNENSSLRRRAGVFAYGNPNRVLEAILKSDPKSMPPMTITAATELMNVRGIHSVSAHLSLADGSLNLQLSARMAAGQSSPIFDLISDQRVTMPMFQPVPKDSTVVSSFALKDGEKHWNRLLAAADAIVGKEGPKPSEAIHQIEEKLKVSIGKEVVGQIAAVTVALPAKQELPKGASEMPMLFITGASPGATERLEQLVPSLLSAVMDDLLDPVSQTIEGIKIRSLPAGKFPWKSPLHYGRSGTTLAFGLDRNLLATSLSGKIGSSAISEPKFAETVKEHDHSAGLGFWRWADLLPRAIVESTTQRRWGPNGQPLAPDPAAQREKEEKLRKTMVGLIRDMPPLVFSLDRDGRQITLNLQQRHAPGSMPTLIEGFCDAVMRGATNVFDTIPQPPQKPAPVKN